MLYFTAIFVLVWSMSYYAYISGNMRNGSYYVALYVICIFTALRYHTGYDWNNYEEVFAGLAISDLYGFNDLFYYSAWYDKEPLYLVVSVLIKSVIDDYQLVQMLSIVVLGIGLHVFLKKRSVHPALVLSVAFSWLVFSLFFSTVRQAFAVGLFFIFWDAYERRKYLLSVVMLITSVLFHYSALLYYIFFFLASSGSLIKARYVFLILTQLFLVVGLLGLNVMSYIFSVIPLGSIGFAADKFEWYIFERGGGDELGNKLIVASFTIMVSWVLYYGAKSQYIYKSRYYGFALLFVLYQAIMMYYPLFRNRMLYAALFVLLLVVVEIMPRRDKIKMNFAYFVLFSYSGLYYFMYLLSPSGEPFVPYQDVVTYKWIGAYEDGTERLQHYLMRHYE